MGVSYRVHRPCQPKNPASLLRLPRSLAEDLVAQGERCEGFFWRSLSRLSLQDTWAAGLVATVLLQVSAALGIGEAEHFWLTTRRGAGGGKTPRKAHEKTSTCAVLALLRTRNVQGCLTTGFWVPRVMVGMQAPDRLLAPAGTRIGSSKVSPDSRTPQRFERHPGGYRTKGMYHVRRPDARLRASIRRTIKRMSDRAGSPSPACLFPPAPPSISDKNDRS